MPQDPDHPPAEKPLVASDGAAGTQPASGDLVQLRALVEHWTRIGADALRAFRRGNGTFWKNSKDANEEKDVKINVTTTTRVYAALVAAARSFNPGDAGGFFLEAFDELAKLPVPPLDARQGRFKENTAPGQSAPVVNNFDVAHLSDLLVARDLAVRFKGRKNKALDKILEKVCLGGLSRDAIRGTLMSALADATQATRRGQVVFEHGYTDSMHYFATLHVLRGLHAIGAVYSNGGTGAAGGGKAAEGSGAAAPGAADGTAGSGNAMDGKTLDAIVEGARSFAIEQCLYYARGTTHRQDPVRLAFAGCIYALYGAHVDKDLCEAIIQSLAVAQQENGSWPTTHPVIREGGTAWHITSHEVALCLTWLYFQPRLPDAARPVLVKMMRAHFEKAVIPTFVTTATAKGGTPLKGWQDDHTVSPNTSVGWASAIVTHFLANFGMVLTDFINRRVIEELGLEEQAKAYIIDDTKIERSWLWRYGDEQTFVGRAIWPDLPPHSWTHPLDPAKTASTITGKWKDPSPGGEGVAALSRKVIQPISESPCARPNGRLCSGLLPGAPGTGKTTFVGKLAEVLRWPMVTVPASIIFARGFELMEASADEVFRKLSYLRGVVIFFDEFEEFFLTRLAQEAIGQDDDRLDDEALEGLPPATASIDVQDPHDAGAPSAAVPSTGPGADGGTGGRSTDRKGGRAAIPVRIVSGSYESRTIAAFTTSAMLPRLQDLHHKGACLIFLATNHPDKIDPAIKRPGRFDFMMTIDHPTLERLGQYVDDAKAQKDLRIGKVHVAAIKAALAARAATRKSGERAKMKFAQFENAVAAVLASAAPGDLAVAFQDAFETEMAKTRNKTDPPEISEL